jgi:hypothetical protein
MHLDHFLQLSSWQQHECYEAPVVESLCCTAQIAHSFMQSEYLPAVDKPSTYSYIALHSVHDHCSIFQAHF